MADGGSFTFELNGVTRLVEHCSPNLTLLQYLRQNGLTGTKEGCAEGDCGACSVVVMDGGTFRSVNSCLLLLPSLAGRRVISIEGVAAEDKLHPVQESMVRHYGSQCGYCTPGFIMSMFEGHYRTDLREPWQIDDQLCGNLCRCTGYRPIRDAARSILAKHLNGDFDRHRQLLAAVGEDRRAFHYEAASEQFDRPASLKELISLLERPGARMICGGTELALSVTKRFQHFPHLISIESVPELRAIRQNEECWEIGAANSLTEVWNALGDEYPALSECFRWFGSRQIRNRASLGGNLATASPIGDSGPVLMALDASLRLVSAQGERVVGLAQFFTGYRQTLLQPGEVIKDILLPRIPGHGPLRERGQFFKVSRRREMDISTVSGCFRIRLDDSGHIDLARIAYGGVAPTPLRLSELELQLTGRPWDRDTVEWAASRVGEMVAPISDVRGSAEYRAAVAGDLLRVLWEDRRGFDREARPVPPRPGPGRKGDLPHESARLHVTGRAKYVDDQAPLGSLIVWPVCSPHARARIRQVDREAAERLPGIHRILVANDLPGLNEIGPVVHDEPLLAAAETFYHGQIVAAIVADHPEAARAAAAALDIIYEPMPAVLSIDDAVESDSFHTEANYIRRGDVDLALRQAELSFTGEFELGGQDHFYLETHAAWARMEDDGGVQIQSSTQHPTEVQHTAAQVLGTSANMVTVESPRMGGGFGGKETQGNILACLTAVAAKLTGKPVRATFNRDQDMMITGKRHPFRGRFTVGFSRTGLITAVRVALISDGGWTLDLSTAITDRALFHLDNCYYFPHVEFSGRVAKTNLASNTAFRGFGGPQGMLVIEEILDRVARTLGVGPEIVRERNLYRGTGETNRTAYGQDLGDNRIPRVWRELVETSDFRSRQAEIQSSRNGSVRRGISITPVKFGISFTATHYNQAGALVLVYLDGTVQVSHGGTEMGQGIHTNIRMIVANELGISADQIRVTSTRTDKIPNTSATAASSGTDLNGAAALDGAQKITQRMRNVAAAWLKVSPEEVFFRDNHVWIHPDRATGITWVALVKRAYHERVSLLGNGFYRTPGIHWDRPSGKGIPFHYFSIGAAVSEVEVDGCTGAFRLVRADILHDVGNSINESVNRGQIEGGFVQGLGWLTTEELVWNDQGQLLTHSPDTYKIPAIGDVPDDFRIRFLAGTPQPTVVVGSKAVGEPPLMLAISVREAIRDAVASFGNGRTQVRLASPATNEAIYWAIVEQKRSKRGKGELPSRLTPAT